MTTATDIFTRHGGRLKEAADAFPRAPRPWLDLSTGINPRAYPLQPVHGTAFRLLPEPGDVRRLEETASALFGCPPDQVAAAPGAEAALRLLPLVLGAGSAAIAAPTYGSHEAAWREAGRNVRLISPDSVTEARNIAETQTIAETHGDALVIVNPNNPDGRFFERPFLRGLAARRAEAGLWTVIDESFIDPAPETSLAGDLPGNTIVLRSFGKFFGLPGLRLGLAVAPADLAARLRNLFGDWPLTPQALATGIAAYADHGWQRRMREQLTTDMRRLESLLAHAGFERVGGTPLFSLQSCADAASWFVSLAEHGILTRPFSANRDWLRFGLPGPGGWARLEAALQAGPSAGEGPC